jgi:hypothetical protein
MNTTLNKIEKRITFIQPQYLDIKKIANSQGMTITGMLMFALREFLEKRNIEV